MRKIRERETNFLILNAKDQILIERTKNCLLAVLKGETLTYQESKIVKKGLKIARRISDQGETWKKTFVNYDIDEFIEICNKVGMKKAKKLLLPSEKCSIGLTSRRPVRSQDSSSAIVEISVQFRNTAQKKKISPKGLFFLLTWCVKML